MYIVHSKRQTPTSRQRGRPTSTNSQLSYGNKNLGINPRVVLAPRQTGRLVVGRNVTHSLTYTLAILGDLKV
jgi:hypothetical protein